MNDLVFRSNYASLYDFLYQEKNYERECDLLEEVFRKYYDSPVNSILDLGCGTGNHAISLAQRGYKVTGVDRSTSMLAHAKSKKTKLFSADTLSNLDFIQSDLRNFDLQTEYDVALMMFAVLGYQTTNHDVLSSLKCVYRCLKPGGIFIGDVWYGPSVLTVRPSDRVKVVPTDNGKIIRTVSSELDTFAHLVKVNYHTIHISGQQIINESEESHLMRYFFPQELIMFMNVANLELKDIFAFDAMFQKPSEHSWNIIFISKK